MVRPVLGPNVIARYDHELAALDGIGLTDVEMDAVVSLLAGHVEGAARRALESAHAERRTGQSDEAWWAARAPLLETLLEPERYPTAMRVGAAAGEEHNAAYAPEHSFEFGLQTNPRRRPGAGGRPIFGRLTANPVDEVSILAGLYFSHLK